MSVPSWDELPAMEEGMARAFYSQYKYIGCPFHEWHKICDNPARCAARGRCYEIHTKRHMEQEDDQGEEVEQT